MARFQARNGARTRRCKVFADFDKAAAAAIRYHAAMDDAQARQDAAAAGRQRRRRARPRCSTGSAPRSAAAAARTSASSICSSRSISARSIRSRCSSLADLYERAEASRARDRGLRTDAGDLAAAAQRRDPARPRSRALEQARRGQAASREADRRAPRRYRGDHRRSAISCAARKQFAECADVYDKGDRHDRQAANAQLGLFYFRGICLERAKRWPEGRGRSEEGARALPGRSRTC